MDPLVALFVHVIVLACVFLLMVWVARKASQLAEPPMQAKVFAGLCVLIGLLALMFLLGEIGLWGTWGFGYHRH
jgi:hypothetical protein